MVDVSVIVVNYKTASLTVACIDSVIACTSKRTSYEIVVIDNNSRDEIQVKLANRYPMVRLIISQENIGFGRANNLGVAEANGEYLFFLNSDTILVSDAISMFVDYMRVNLHVGACCGNLLTTSLKPNYSFGLAHTSLLSVFLYRTRLNGLFNRFHTHFNEKDIPIPVEMIIGADFFVRKNIFTKIGGFDPYYFMYMEDTDLSQAVKSQGLELHNLPQVEIIHIQGGSGSNENAVFWEVLGFEHYFRKYRNDTIAKIYLLLDAFLLLIKMLSFAILFRIKKVYQYKKGFLYALYRVWKMKNV